MKDKTAAGVLAILLGGLGVHKFYLGQAGMGLLYLLFCWTFIPALIALIEGILLLTMDQASFNTRYNGAAMPLSASHAPSPAPAASSPSDVAKQIESLFALKQSGALTEDEFNSQKRKLLDGVAEAPPIPTVAIVRPTVSHPARRMGGSAAVVALLAMAAPIVIAVVVMSRSESPEPSRQQATAEPEVRPRVAVTAEIEELPATGSKEDPVAWAARVVAALQRDSVPAVANGPIVNITLPAVEQEGMDWCRSLRPAFKTGGAFQVVDGGMAFCRDKTILVHWKFTRAKP